MEIFNPYSEAIFISGIIIISFFFNFVSKKINVPSVLLLIGLGIGIQEILKEYDIDLGEYVEVMGWYGVTKEESVKVFKKFTIVSIFLISGNYGITGGGPGP